MMKKQMQQPRVKTGLWVRRYLGNSSEMEVTMVSMVANWNGTRKRASEIDHAIPKAPESPLCFPQGTWYLYQVCLLGLPSLDGPTRPCWVQSTRPERECKQDVSFRNYLQPHRACTHTHPSGELKLCFVFMRCKSSSSLPAFDLLLEEKPTLHPTPKLQAPLSMMGSSLSPRVILLEVT